MEEYIRAAAATRCYTTGSSPHPAAVGTTNNYSETVYIPTKNYYASKNMKQPQQYDSMEVLQNISGMPQYADQSQEELRWNDSSYCNYQQSSGRQMWNHPPPGTSSARATIAPPLVHHTNNYNTPVMIRRQGTVLEYVAPETLDSDFAVIGQVVIHKTNDDASSSAEECPICLEPLSPQPLSFVGDITLPSNNDDKTVRLAGCGHCFHVGCLDGALKNKRACPNCRQELGIGSLGKMPSGTMTITRRPATASPSMFGQGRQAASIVIQYDFPAGRQKEYHPAPGAHYPAANFTAYLPDDTKGRHLLERLQQSFARGLTFVVGHPFGMVPSRICEWIPHLSLPPPTPQAVLVDPEYWNHCHQQLDLVGVP